MAKIALVTDSAACIPKEISEKYHILVAPIHIAYNKDELYRDNVDITPQEFYTRMRKMGPEDKLPTTSSAIQGEYLKIFEKLKGKVDGVAVAVLTGALGASYSTALAAKGMVSNLSIEVVDTKTAQCGQGFAVVAAAKVAKDGGTLEDVVKVIREVSAKSYVFWTMETLEYMRKGGRVPVSASPAANELEIKPMMALNREGKVDVVAGVKTMSEGIEKMLSLLRERVSHTPLHIAVVHGDALSTAHELRSRIEIEFNPAETWIAELTPAIGVHFGPGTLGISFYNE